MVDNRAAGFYGIGSGFEFKSGSISGTVANMSEDKMGQGGEYTYIDNSEEDGQNRMQYVDRSAQLRATLNSLAMMNVANVLNERKRLERLAKKTNSNKFEQEHEFDYLNTENEFGKEFLEEIEEFENETS